MSAPGLSLSEGSVSQSLDLSEIFEVDFSGREALKLAICQSMVDVMRERTSKGKDINGSSFAPYSSSYKKSEEFIAYGKSSTVDMQLSGDMMAAIDFETEGNRVTILFDNSEDEEKAYGHMTGMKGHPVLDGKTPKREFFGITKDEIESIIMPQFKADIDALKEQNPEYVSLENAFLSLSAGQSSERTLEDLLSDL